MNSGAKSIAKCFVVDCIVQVKFWFPKFDNKSVNATQRQSGKKKTKISIVVDLRPHALGRSKNRSRGNSKVSNCIRPFCKDCM